MIPLMVLTAALAWMGVQGTGRRVCYYTNWAQYRPGYGKYIPENINATLCTHIAIAFGKISYNTLGPYELNDESTPDMNGTFEKIVNLKNTNPDLKVLLSVGGWNAQSEPFNIILQSQPQTNIFANEAAKYLRLKGMDGLDVDWEYPTNKAKYSILIKTLKDAFIAEADDSGRERLLLTSAVPAGKYRIDSGFDVPFVAEIMDFITVMTYDLHGSWQHVTGHHTAMYAGPWETGVQRYWNVEWVMNYWHQLGVPKSKLNLGLATYGRCFTLQSASQNQVNDLSTGPSIAGNYTSEKGFLSYYEICEMIHQQGAVKEYISDQKVPYLVKGDQWCGFDDILSIKMKVQYGMSEGFGGIAVWSMDLDDFNGLCDQKYPLMTTIFEEMRSNAPFVGPTSPEKETSTTYKKYSRKLTSDVWKDWITTTTMKPLTTEMKTTSDVWKDLITTTTMKPLTTEMKTTSDVWKDWITTTTMKPLTTEMKTTSDVWKDLITTTTMKPLTTEMKTTSDVWKDWITTTTMKPLTTEMKTTSDVWKDWITTTTMKPLTTEMKTTSDVWKDLITTTTMKPLTTEMKTTSDVWKDLITTTTMKPLTTEMKTTSDVWKDLITTTTMKPLTTEMKTTSDVWKDWITTTTMKPLTTEMKTTSDVWKDLITTTTMKPLTTEMKTTSDVWKDWITTTTMKPLTTEMKTTSDVWKDLITTTTMKPLTTEMKTTSDVWKDWITTTTMKPLTTEMKKTRPTTNSDPCFGRNGGFMPDANDCQKFWVCFYGTGYARTCPELTLWNGVVNYCDWAANVICSPSSQI